MTESAPSVWTVEHHDYDDHELLAVCATEALALAFWRALPRRTGRARGRPRYAQEDCQVWRLPVQTEALDAAAIQRRAWQPAGEDVTPDDEGGAV